MTDVETLERTAMKCVFVAEWKCPIETPAIPLEVCKLCLEAKKLQSQQVVIKRPVREVELVPAQKVVEDTVAEVPHVVF